MAILPPTWVISPLRAGDTAIFHRVYQDYSSADGWAATIYFNGPSANYTATGVAAADGGFDFTVPATTTAPLAAGSYRYVERVSKSPEVYTVGEGIQEITPNLATAAAGATQTHEEKTLAVIEAALSGRLTSDMQSYQIAGRSVVKIPILDLVKLKNIYAAKVAAQHNPNQLGADYQVQFGLPVSGLNTLGRWPWQ